MLSQQMTKGDFVRILRRGPESAKEYLWLYLYREGFIDVPLNWHLSFFAFDIGAAMLAILTPAVNLITRLCLTLAGGDKANRGPNSQGDSQNPPCTSA
jgi:hypothetical protein